MEYPQRCYFLVDRHNRTESRMKLWTSLFVVFIYCSCVYPRNRGFVKKYTWSLALVGEIAEADYGTLEQSLGKFNWS